MFTEDFVHALELYPHVLSSKKQISALLRDLFPTQVLQVSLLSAAYDIGIVQGIQGTCDIGKSFAYRFEKRLVEECGLSFENAAWAVETWCTGYGVQILKKPCSISHVNPQKKGSHLADQIYSHSNSVDADITTVTNLTADQNRAVTTNSKRCVVVAGPGSGKTRVLTERIAYLVETQGIAPEKILAITFTNKAVGEMKKRIYDRLATQSVSIEVRTFHSFGLRLLREYSECIGLGPDFEIASSSTVNRILTKILNRHGQTLSEKKSDYRAAISRLKNGIRGNYPVCIDEVFAEYNHALRSEGLIDLDDMIFLPVQMLSANRDISNRLKSKYQHILVDEFQDVNEMQAKLFPHIIGADTSFFFVGDDDQCIYEWRGARPKLLKRYAGDSKSDTIYLEDNFRSRRGIVSLSDLFISHNADRIPKRLNARKQVSGSDAELKATTSFNRFSSNESEATFIADEIQSIVDTGKFRYDDIAVLLRSEKLQGTTIRDALSKSEIPFSGTANDDRLYDGFLTVLHTVKDFNKKGNLSKAINFPTRVMDGILYSELKDQFDLGELSSLEGFQFLANCPYDFEMADIFKARYKLLFELSQKSTSIKPSEIIAKLLDYYQNEEQLSAEAIGNIQKILHLLEVAIEFENASGDEPHLDMFLDYIYTALQNETNVSIEKGAVNIITCHKAKGLEFPVVFIPGVQVGIFPNDYFITTTEKLEEERRLFYVSMTRAMERLYITCFGDPLKGSNSGGIIREGFISEVPRIVQGTA